jgi:hypothetical protein
MEAIKSAIDEMSDKCHICEHIFSNAQSGDCDQLIRRIATT